MFGQQSQTQSSSPFKFPSLSLTTTTSQATPGLFGTSQSAQKSSGFGTPQPPGGGLFGGGGQNAQPPGTGLFSGQQSTTQGSSPFSNLGQTMQQQGGGVLGGFGQSGSQQPGSSFFPNSGLGQSNQQNQSTSQRQSIFGQPQQIQDLQAQQSQFGQTQQQLPTLQLGQSQQARQTGPLQSAPALWEEGRGLGVYRTIPAQVGIIKERWDASNLASPLRTYLYQKVDDENQVPFFQPSALDDEHKWEEAVANRPGPNFVPVLVRGFWDLGKRAQRQREYIERCNIRLHDINQSLDAQLEIHNQRIATRIAECRRRHVFAAKRTLALAAKVQILRNKGYVMDNTEEDLRAKLVKLEREVFDPNLSGREQEIWARMLGIRERGKTLKAEMEKAAPIAQSEEATLDEETIKTAKKMLEAYDTQLRHLEKELQMVVQEYGAWEKISDGEVNGTSMRQ